LVFADRVFISCPKTGAKDIIKTIQIDIDKAFMKNFWLFSMAAKLDENIEISKRDHEKP
jgi:hypothetical protein